MKLYRRVAVALSLVGLYIGVVGLPALAVTGQPVPITTDSNSLAQIKLSPYLVTLLIGTVIPLLTGLLTKLGTSSAVKYVVTVILNAANAAIVGAVMVGGSYIITKENVITAIFSVIVSIGAYRGWKSVGLTSSAIVMPSPTVSGQTVYIPGKLADKGVT
jgi:hypothetical protein